MVAVGDRVLRGNRACCITVMMCGERTEEGDYKKGASNHSCVTTFLYLVLQAVMLPHTGAGP